MREIDRFRAEQLRNVTGVRAMGDAYYWFNSLIEELEGTPAAENIWEQAERIADKHVPDDKNSVWNIFTTGEMYSADIYMEGIETLDMTERATEIIREIAYQTALAFLEVEFDAIAPFLRGGLDWEAARTAAALELMAAA